MVKNRGVDPKKKGKTKKKVQNGEASYNPSIEPQSVEQKLGSKTKTPEKTTTSGKTKSKKKKKDKKEKSKETAPPRRVSHSKTPTTTPLSRIEQSPTKSKRDTLSKEQTSQLPKTKTEVGSLIKNSKEGKLPRKQASRAQSEIQKKAGAPSMVDVACGQVLGAASPESAPVAVDAPSQQPVKPQPPLPPAALQAMDQFYKYIMGQSFDAVRAEYDKIQEKKPTAIVKAELLKTAWDPNVPCLENNRISTAAGMFCHANNFTYQRAENEKKEKPYILCQVPQPTVTGIEHFWQMVFQAEAGLVFVLTPFFENGKGCVFFPVNDAEYKDYGQIRVSVRKIEKHKLGTNYLFEVLPEGCSNAIFVKLIHCEQWEPAATPPLKTFLQMMQTSRESDPQSPIVCVSRKGTGRVAVLSTACIVYNRLLQGQFTPVEDVALALRDARAGAFENIAQYVYVYVAVTGYIKGRTNEAQWTDAMEHMTRWRQEVEKYCAGK